MIPAGVVDAADAVARSLIYLATFWTVGAASFATLVVPRARLTTASASSLIEISAAWMRRGAAWLLGAYLLRFYLHIVDSYQSPWPTPHAVYMMLFWTLDWGKGVMAQWLVTLAAWAWLRVRGPARVGQAAQAGLAVLISAAVPLTGHAIAHGGVVAGLLQALHVLAIGAWLGTLAVVTLAWRTSVTDEAQVVRLVRAFSTVAIWSVSALLVTGVAAVVTHLETPADLVRTAYGGVLLAKVLSFGAAAALGARHWRATARGLGLEGLRDIRATVLMELALGAVATVLAGVLTGLPRPGDE